MEEITTHQLLRSIVKMMKDKNAIIGGEGNGGVILPELHYGRDALVGIALFLTYYKMKMKMSDLKKSFPAYTISKNKLELDPVNIDSVLKKMSDKYKSVTQNKVDGLKLDFENGWVHMRKSNTEPIIRIYAESVNSKTANDLGERFANELKRLIKLSLKNFMTGYFDTAATTPIAKEVIKEIEPYLHTHFGNPSSILWKKDEECYRNK